MWCLSLFYKQLLLKESAAVAAAKSRQSCPTLCNPIDGLLPGSSVPGILRAKTLEWVAISFSNAWKWKVKVKALSRVRLSDPMDYNLPGSSIHGIFQARVLEWGAIAFSRCSLQGKGIPKQGMALGWHKLWLNFNKTLFTTKWWILEIVRLSIEKWPYWIYCFVICFFFLQQLS